jgi:UDP-4-amino-4,6-dideoxy-N-acetyl-beta-L-altrosamine N-acetyltransferase
MIIEQYGIKLIRVTLEDIELIRYWRNHPSIRRTMHYRKYISKSMQIRWFESINNPLNYYFIIEYNNKKIGVINCKKININEGYGEGGIFIWEKDIENEYIPVFASLCLLNTVFYVFKIFNKSFVQVLNTNTKAISFNKQLGYILVPGQEKNRNPYYVLTREDYLMKSKKFNHIAKKLSNSKDIKISGGISSNNLIQLNNLFLEGNKEFIYSFES